MRQKKIMMVLLAVLCLSVGILGINLLVLYQNVYHIPDAAVEDLCRILAEDKILLKEYLVPRKRQDALIYVSDNSDYEENSARLLTGSEIRQSYVIPEGQLFLHYNGDITEFSSDFVFHYRSALLESEREIGHYDAAADQYAVFTEAMQPLPEDGDAAMTAIAFLDKQDESLKRTVQIRTVIDSVWCDSDGRAYVKCLRQIDGAQITENAVICLVENGVVTEAVGKWCFMHFGESYMTQLSDVTNILFMMKRTLAGTDRPGPGGYCRILGLERCYSLYFLAGNGGFCLIPSWRIETDTMGEFVYSALDGTLYTKMDEIT